MSILSQSKCCKCAACADKPKWLVVTVAYPSASGTMIAASPDGFWADVTTTCSLPTHLNGVRHINLLDAGEGYEDAPSIEIEGKAGGYSRLVSHIESVTIDAGGSNYAVPPQVKFVGGFAESELKAVGVAVLAGAITEIKVGSPGAGYEKAPRIEVCGGTGAVLTPVLDGYVAKITVEDKGSGYDPLVPPTISLSGDGTGAAAHPTLVGRVDFITDIVVTDPGRGYEMPPEVVVTDGGRRVIARANIKLGSVTDVELLQAGDGVGRVFGAPETVPVVKLVGGGGIGATAEAIVDTGVTAIFVQHKGSGYSEPPTVTISGNATAAAHLNYYIDSVVVEQGGEGYPYQPKVSFLGDCSAPATGQATISGQVAAVRLYNQGRYHNEAFEGSTPPTKWPTIEISAAGLDKGTGAAATPVFQTVPVDTAGIPTVSSGDLGDVQTVVPGYGYSSPPTVTLSGGGGTGATAEAVLEWSPEQTFRIPIRFCNDYFFEDNCFDSASEQYPGAPCLGCGGQPGNTGEPPPTAVRFGENLGWGVRAGLKLIETAASPSIVANTWGALARNDVVFPGEAIFVYSYSGWSVPHDLGFAIMGPQKEEKLIVQRFYNRVPPVAEYGFPYQPDSATNAVLTPVLQQYTDRKGEPIWFIKSFNIVSPGSNLLFIETQEPPWPVGGEHGGDHFAIPTSGNAVGYAGRKSPVFFDNYVVSYSPPEVGAWSSSAAFTEMPTLAFAFEPAVGFGEYRIASVTVEAGGTTEEPDGEYLLSIQSLSVGHVEITGIEVGNLGSLTLVIANGQAASVQINNPGSFRGGGTLESVEFTYDNIDDAEAPESTQPEVIHRVLVGSSSNETVVTYSEPEVLATVLTDGTPAQLAVVLSEDVDVAGNPYWTVASVTVVDGGSGHEPGAAVLFAVQGDDGIEAVAAQATAVLPAREEPTLVVGSAGDGAGAEFEVTYSQISGVTPAQWQVDAVAVIAGGFGYQNEDMATFTLGVDDHVLAPALTQILTVIEEPTVSATVSTGGGALLECVLAPAGGNFWTVQAINIVAAGTNYENGEPVVFTGGTWPDNFAEATISTDANGAITAVNIVYGGQFQQDTGVIDSITMLSPGAYYKQPSGIESIDVHFGGRYFVRTITETTTPIGERPPTCIGGAWEEVIYPRDSRWDAGEPWDVWHEVGASWESTAQVGCWTGSSSVLTFQRTRVCPAPTITVTLE